MQEKPYRRRPPTVVPGEKYGRLAVIAHAGTANGKRLVLTRCECGAEKVIRAAALKNGNTRSCGCLHRDELVASNMRCKGSHGHARGGRVSPTYNSWTSMIARTTRSDHMAYANYGGRGISVCPRWRTFENFLADMGERPKGKTLDRIDNDGNYEPGNCRWASPSEQTKNQRPRAQMVSCRHGHDNAEMALRRDGRWYCKACRRARDRLRMAGAA